MACYCAVHNSAAIYLLHAQRRASDSGSRAKERKTPEAGMLRAHGFDNRRWFDLTWVRYLRITLCADPPRARVIVASARAVVFSVTMRNASDWAFGPPAKSFIILKCITCCVSKPSIAASPVIFIQFLNNMYLRVALSCRKDNLTRHCSFRAGSEMRQSRAANNT